MRVPTTLPRNPRQKGAESRPASGIARRLRRFTNPSEIRRIAKEAQVPEATLRGVLSFYTDFQSPSGQMRVCQGTSCKLAGAAALGLFPSIPL